MRGQAGQGSNVPDPETDVLEPVMISALEHWSYCPRHCALIHLEQAFDENLYTLRGRAVHEAVDEVKVEEREGIRIERSVPLWSGRLGLVGKADVVEFHGEAPYPVEYKHGPKRRWGHDDLQLCAQAICLEEMLEREVPRGAIYHHSSRRRREVEFTEDLRSEVEHAVTAIRHMLAETQLPPAVNDARCRHCSLKDSCMPSVIAEAPKIRVLQKALFQAR